MAKNYIEMHWNMNSEPIHTTDYKWLEIPSDYNELMKMLTSTKDLTVVGKIGDYLNKNKKKYPLVQLWYARELYDEQIKKISCIFSLQQID